MRNYDPWNNFLQSGSIFDYLTYKSVQEVDEEYITDDEQKSENDLTEESIDENKDRWSNY